MFCTAQYYKDTALTMVAQGFEMISEAHETSWEKLPETTEGVCPGGSNVGKAFLCAGAPAAPM